MFVCLFVCLFYFILFYFILFIYYLFVVFVVCLSLCLPVYLFSYLERKCPFWAEEDEIHFLFNREMYNEFRIDSLGIGPNGGNSNVDEVVFLKEMFNTSPRKLARYIEKAYDLKSIYIKT